MEEITNNAQQSAPEPQSQAPIQPAVEQSAPQPAFQPTPAEPVVPSAPETTSSVAYASFGKRLVAQLIDTAIIFAGYILISLIVGLVTLPLNIALLGTEPNATSSSGDFVMVTIGLLIFFVEMVVILMYPIYMNVKYAGTIGKKAMKIKVVNENSMANLTWIESILRETVGRIASSMVFCLGYLWMLWDPKMQTWHDKLGKSIVINA